MTKLLRELTYARVVSTLALFIALGGGAYAISIGKNDVGPKQIRKGAVRSAEIKDDAVKGRDIARNTIAGGKIKNDSLGRADIDEEDVLEGMSAAASKDPFWSTCDPVVGSGLTPCASIELATPVAGKVLAIASGNMVSNSTGGGDCELTLDGKLVSRSPSNAPTQPKTPFTLVGISRSVSAGMHTVGLQCREGSDQFHVEVSGLTATLASAP